MIGVVEAGGGLFSDLEESFGIVEDGGANVVVVVSEERVVRFIGNSTAGGEPLGWLRVVTMTVAIHCSMQAEHEQS
jgi:hypothetical protein